MKIGNPTKQRVRVDNSNRGYCIFADDKPVMRWFSRREAFRFAVILRRQLAD